MIPSNLGGGYNADAAAQTHEKDRAVIGRRYRVRLKNNYQLGYPQIPPGVGPIGYPPDYNMGIIVYEAPDEIEVILRQKIPGSNESTKRWECFINQGFQPIRHVPSRWRYHDESFFMPYDKFDLLGSIQMEQTTMVGFSNGYGVRGNWFRRPPMSPTSGLR